MEKIHFFTARIEVPEFAHYMILEFDVFRTNSSYVLVPVYKVDDNEIEGLSNQIPFNSNWEAEDKKQQKIISWVKEIFDKKQWKLF